MAGRARTVTDQQIAVVAALRDRGMTITAAAELAGVETKSLHYHVKNLELGHAECTMALALWCGEFSQRILDELDEPSIATSVEQSALAAANLAKWAEDGLFCLRFDASEEATVETEVLTHE